MRRVKPPESRWDDTWVESWDELVAALHTLEFVPVKEYAGNHRRSNFVFRGMSDEAWPLNTSLERLGSLPGAVELPALRAFGKYAPPNTFKTEWECLAVAQHNGLPTRVLDWTASPLIAAHFATAESEFKTKDGVIWAVDSVIVRDQLLPQAMLDELRADQAWVYSVPLLNSGKFPTLRHFDLAGADNGDSMIFFEPPSIDARIQNQFGILSAMNGSAKSHDQFLWHRQQTFPELVRRVVIDHRAKQEVRDMLDQNNISERMLFPGLPGLCDWLRRYYGPA